MGYLVVLALRRALFQAELASLHAISKFQVETRIIDRDATSARCIELEDPVIKGGYNALPRIARDPKIWDD